MTKKLFKNNNYLVNDSEDETETVEWIDKIDNKKFFDCGCCKKCLCDDNMSCKNCGCSCNGDGDDCDDCDDDDDCDEECSEESDDSNSDENQLDNKEENLLKELANLSNFNIKIVESKDGGKKVRITLELNVMLDNKKNEVISIDLDINSETYLKIAQDLF
jgi:hypothetical protein